MIQGIKPKEKRLLIEALETYSNDTNRKEICAIMAKVQNSLSGNFKSNKFKIPPQFDLRRKLKEGDIDLIRQMRASGETYNAIARHFGISQPYVFALCNDYAMQKMKERNKIWCRGRYDKKALERCRERKEKLGLENKLIEKEGE